MYYTLGLKQNFRDNEEYPTFTGISGVDGVKSVLSKFYELVEDYSDTKNYAYGDTVDSLIESMKNGNIGIDNINDYLNYVLEEDYNVGNIFYNYSDKEIEELKEDYFSIEDFKTDKEKLNAIEEYYNRDFYEDGVGYELSYYNGREDLYIQNIKRSEYLTKHHDNIDDDLMYYAGEINYYTTLIYYSDSELSRGHIYTSSELRELEKENDRNIRKSVDNFNEYVDELKEKLNEIR